MSLQLPLLFDVLTVLIFGGGCLLVYLGRRAERETSVASVNTPGRPWGREESVQPAAEPPTKRIDATELQTQPETALLNTPLLDLIAATEGDNRPEHNKYARSVSAALAKSRHLTAN